MARKGGKGKTLTLKKKMDDGDGNNESLRLV